jgi:hypothetical protein
MPTNLKKLGTFAKNKAHSITRLPVKLTLSSNLPRGVSARTYTWTFVPDDKKIKPYPVYYEIAFDKNYYRRYRNDPYELKQALLHEIAHISVPKKHGKQYKRIAKKLGTDENHQRATWD